MILHDVFIGTLYLLGAAGAVMLGLVLWCVIRGMIEGLRKHDD